MTKRYAGFTLIEVAIVTAVLTLLLGGLLIPLAAQVDQRRYSETRKSLEEVKDALLGFAQVNGRLPCPGRPDGSGIEQAPPCQEGPLPWGTLNIPGRDAWGREFRYGVSPALTQAPVRFSSATVLQVVDSVGTNRVLADRVAAVVFSTGKNGNLAQIPAESADEAQNASQNGRFVSRNVTAGGAGCSDTTAGNAFCEFDDIVIWISPFVLFTRMDQAGQIAPPP